MAPVVATPPATPTRNERRLSVSFIVIGLLIDIGLLPAAVIERASVDWKPGLASAARYKACGAGAAIIIFGNLSAGSLLGGALLPVTGIAFLLGQIVLFDRECYSLSWFGAGLRAILIFTAYISLVLVTVLGLIYIGLVD